MSHRSMPSSAILARLVAFVAVLLLALPATAQRSLTNTNSGNDPRVQRTVDTLGGCANDNLGRLGVGNADACLGKRPNAESTADASALLASYSAGVAYTLSLSSSAPDRRSGGGGLSSGGLFNAIGLGVTGSIGLQFQRAEVGDFLLAISGTYRNSSTNGQELAWSAYYIYDFISTQPAFLPGFSEPVPLLVAPFFTDSFFDGTQNEFVQRLNFTEGLVTHQVSWYRLDRTADPAGQVPLPGTLALAGLALAAGWGVRRWRRAAAPAAC